MHALVGTPHRVIADIVGIDLKTLYKYYRVELDQSGAQATAAIGGALYNKAINGDTTAMIFWLKTQAGWRETARVDHTSSDGSMSPAKINLSRLSPSALAELQRAVDDLEPLAVIN